MISENVNLACASVRECTLTSGAQLGEDQAGAVEPDNTSALEVFRLVDKLDDLIHNAKPVPLTSHVRIDRKEAYALLDELRVAVVTLAKQGTSGF